MADGRADAISPLNPSRAASGVVAYLGRMAILGCSAAGSLIFPARASGSLFSETTRQIDRLLAVGVPMMALIHVGMGSFLAMQAYFGATFIDGIGPVVGVGLIRNLSPLLTGFFMAGLMASRAVPEFRGRAHPPADAARMAAARMAAAMVAGPVLTAWGSLVGIAAGWAVARSMMGVSLPAFFDLFLEMLWARDIVGLAVKGAAFGMVAALFGCQEGLSRAGSEDDPEADCSAAGRAACLASLAILAINSGWFLLVYHAGSPFGPTVLAPPTR